MDHGTQNKNSLNILLVENSRTVRAVLTNLLENNGHKVSGSPNGLDAINQLQSKAYDLIIMDVFMPQMNGYEAAKHIRALADQNKAKTPLIALTSSQNERDKRACFEAGMNEYILKSQDQAELLAALKKYA